MDFTLTQLSTFCMVVEEGTITAAARVLHLTQPAVSIQLKQLEESLGSPLLYRDRPRLALTPAGDELYKHARILLDQRAIILQRLSELKNLTDVRLCVGATTGTLYHIAPVIASFRRRLSNIQVDLQTNISDVIHRAVETRDVDVGFTWEQDRPGGSQLISDRLFTDELVCVIAREHPFAAFTQVPIRSLAGQRLVTTTKGSLTYNFIRTFLERFDVDPQFLPMQNTESIKHAVEAGLGVAILSRKSVDLEVLHGTLVAKRFKESACLRNVVMAYQVSHSPACDTFLEHVRNSFPRQETRDFMS